MRIPTYNRVRQRLEEKEFGDEFVLLVPVQVFRKVGDGHIPEDGSRFPEHSEIGKVLIPLSEFANPSNGKAQTNGTSNE